MGCGTVQLYSCSQRCIGRNLVYCFCVKHRPHVALYMAAVPVYLSIFFALAYASVLVQGDWAESAAQPEIAIVTAPHHVIVEKKSSFLLNCSVVTSKKFGPVVFEWYKDGEPLIFDRRIKVFQNGSLYFSRIVHRKRRQNRTSDEGLYECWAGNNNSGRIIVRRVSLEVAGIARNFTKEPVPTVAFAEGSARFDCNFKAKPPAAILWQKDSTQLTIDNHRVIQLPSGTLQIHNVSKSDEGFYRCMAGQTVSQLPDEVTNLKWKWSRQAMLTVQPAILHEPRMLAFPQNTTVLANSEAVVMECLSDGNPQPTIEWRRPDKPLTDRHQILGRGNLMIVNVKPEDTGVYQCFVKRGHFEQLHSAILNVHTYPLMIDDPKSNAYDLMRSVVLDCSVKGNPKPTIMWYFNGTLVHKLDQNVLHYKISEKGALIIYNIKLQNAGYYQCIAENALGQVIALARIVVFEHKDAPTPPQDVTVTALNSSALKVDWKLEVTNFPILTFLINYRNIEKPVQDKEQVMVEGSSRSTNLTGLLSYTTYEVTIYAFNKKGGSVASRSVQGRTLEGVPRATPTFQIISPSATTMLITWDEIGLSYRGGVITHYQLQYSLAHEGSDVTTHIISDPSQRSFLIEDLEPETTYAIRIAAATKNGFPENLGSWTHHTMPSAVTSSGLSVPRLKVDVLNMSAVLLHWELVEISRDVNYHIQAIELRRLDVDQRPVNFTVDPPQTDYVLTGLENNTDYEVTVHDSQHQIQVTHTFRISDGLLAPKANELHSQVISPTTMRLDWIPSDKQLDIIKYEVCYKEVNSDAPLEAHCVDSEKPYAVISELKAFTKYKFGVRIITNQNEPGAFTTLEVVTSEDKPGPPVNLTYEVLKKGSVSLQWSPPSQPNGVIISYLIFYNMDSSVPDTAWKNLTKSGQQTIAQVDDLDIRQYFFKMSACNRAGRSDPTKTVVVYPDCSAGTCSSVTSSSASVRDLTDKQAGILIGIGIGVVCIIICAVVILCRHRCFHVTGSRIPIIQQASGAPGYDNGCVMTGRGNGHAHAVLPSDQTVGVEMTALERMPMLTRLPENELSDAKGGGDMIITANGVRVNGLVKTNGHLPNGHITPIIFDNNTTAEEKHSLIDAMLAATNGNPHQQASELALAGQESNFRSDGDVLTTIDHWDSREPSQQLEAVLAGNVVVSPTPAGGWTPLPTTHFAPFPKKEDTGREQLPPCRDKEGGCWQQQGGEEDIDSAQNLVPSRHNVMGGEQDHPYPEPQQGSSSSSSGSPLLQHLRKPATFSPRQPATSQLQSPGHCYLATSPLPPPPPPPPLPSPPPSPPSKGKCTPTQAGVMDPQEGGKNVQREGIWEEIGESHREGGVTFAPPPLLPQSSSYQAAAASASMAASAAQSEEQKKVKAPSSLSSSSAARLEPRAQCQC